MISIPRGRSPGRLFVLTKWRSEPLQDSLRTPPPPVPPSYRSRNAVSESPRRSRGRSPTQKQQQQQTHQQKLQAYFKHFNPPPPPPPRDRSLSPFKKRSQSTGHMMMTPTQEPNRITRQGRPLTRDHQRPIRDLEYCPAAPQPDEVVISFEQVEPKTYRVVGGKTTLSGPVPATNKVAPRQLRRTFPQLNPGEKAKKEQRQRTSEFFSFQKHAR